MVQASVFSGLFIRMKRETESLPQPKFHSLAETIAFFQAVLLEDFFGFHSKAQRHIAQRLAFLDGVFLRLPVLVAQLLEIHHVAAVEHHLVGTAQQVVVAELLVFDAEVLGHLLWGLPFLGVDEAHTIILIDETFLGRHVDKLERRAVGGRIGQFQQLVLWRDVGQLVMFTASSLLLSVERW